MLENNPAWVWVVLISVVSTYTILAAAFEWPLWTNSRQVRRFALFLPMKVIRILYIAISVMALMIAALVALGVITD